MGGAGRQPSCGRERDSYVAEDRVGGDGDLVLDLRAAAGAAEQPELHGVVDEEGGIADQRVGVRDRAHVLQAGILVVGIERAEGGPAVAAGPVGAGCILAHVEGIGRAEPEIAVALRLRRRAVGEPGEAVGLDRGAVACGRLDIHGGLVLAQHGPEDRPRRLRRDVLVQEVVLNLRGVAPHGVAEAATAGPAHRIDIRRVLVEVLLPQLQVLGPARDLRMVVDQAALGHALQDVALADELVGVGGGREAPHHPGRGRRRVARRQRVLGDALGVVGDEAGLGGEPAAVPAGAAGIRQLLAVEHEQREVLLVVLHVGELADRRACLAAGVDAVGVGEGADGAADGVDQQVAVALAPLVDAAEERRRPLAGAADAHDVAAQLLVREEHLGDRVVGGVERYLHGLGGRGRHAGREVGAVERACRRIEVDVPERAAHREILVPREQLVDRHHDRAAPAGISGVHGAVLRRGAVVVEDQPVALLGDGDLHPVGAPVPRPAGLDVGAVAPGAVGQPLQLGEEGGLGIVDDALHHALDRARPVAADELQQALARAHVAGELGAEVERHHLGLARGAQVKLLDIAADHVVLDDLHRRDENSFVEGALGGGAEAPRRDAADVVLMQAVGDPAEELALPEHRADHHHVHLVRGADPGVVGEEHVALADAGIVAAVLQDPLHLRVGDARHVLHVGAEIDELGVLGEDRGVEVERVDRHRRARDALDRGAVLLVDVPEVVADHLVGDGIDLGLPVPVQGELVGDAELARRHVGLGHAVEAGLRHLADAPHGRDLWAGIHVSSAPLKPLKRVRH